MSIASASGTRKTKPSSPENMVRMTVSQAKMFIQHRYMRQIKHGEILSPVFFMGPPGHGKTSLVMQSAEELSPLVGSSVEVVPAHLVALSRLDLYGATDRDESGNMINLRSRLVPKDGFKILFFDEGNRADEETSNGLLTLLDPRQRSINEHKLGPFVMPTLTGNPVPKNKASRAVMEFCEALEDRMAWVWVQLTPSEYAEYLKNKYKDHFMVKYFIKNMSIVSFDGEDGVTPRRFERAIESARGVPTENRELLLLSLQSELGVDVGQHVLDFMNREVIDPNFSDILSGEASAFDFAKKHSLLRLDWVMKMSEELRSYCREAAFKKEKQTPEVKKNVQDFLLMLTPEARLGIIRSESQREVYDYIVNAFFNSHEELRRSLLQTIKPMKLVA